MTATPLTQKKCIPCEAGTPPLNHRQIAHYQKELSLPWQVHDDKKISHQFVFGSFKESIHFVNQVADLAETEGHHPDIHVSYKKVLIELLTHAIDGLSENDFVLASKIEQLVHATA